MRSQASFLESCYLLFLFLQNKEGSQRHTSPRNTPPPFRRLCLITKIRVQTSYYSLNLWCNRELFIYKRFILERYISKCTFNLLIYNFWHNNQIMEIVNIAFSDSVHIFTYFKKSTSSYHCFFPFHWQDSTCMFLPFFNCVTFRRRLPLIMIPDPINIMKEEFKYAQTW